MCDKVKVEAWDVENPKTRVIGESGRGQENCLGLFKYMANFATRLQAAKRIEKWSMFTCAEVNAAYLLALRHNVPLHRIRIGRAEKGKYLIYAPCKNCAQWLLSDGSQRYRIRGEFGGEVKKTSKPPNLKSKIDFPSL